jgi:DNA repair protein RecO (recombination protein O)
MQWSDEGIVLGARPHGESSVILELMTREHGRHLGLVRGGRGRRMRPVLQPGNLVSAVWRARLDQHLGHFTVEGLNLRVADLLPHSHALFGMTHIAALCRLLPERDPHPLVAPMIEAILDRMDDVPLVAALIVHFELQLLADLGFGLELDRCAVTGTRTGLIYVSPKSGRAVSGEAGEAWKDQLLRLPAFLSGQGDDDPSMQDLDDAFRLTGYFLTQRVLEPRGVAFVGARGDLIGAVLRPRARQSAAGQ